ncbi:MAG: PIG-L family deacetylase [Anaerolineales bacterium]|nr:PIG-L family deacetylase [Anaerolineales bacterium]
MTAEHTLIFVGAHPDDESFGIGGTLARYAQAGVRTYYACATRGEVGEASPEHLAGHQSPGDMRWAELMCAAQVLGLADVLYLGYRDSGMPGSPDNHAPGALAAAPLDEVTGRVVAVLRRLQPQVVITFDPIGGYRHPDHIAMYQAATRAFHAAGDASQYPQAGPVYQPQKLYYSVFTRTLLKLAVRLLPLMGRDPRRFGINHDIDLVSLTTEDFPVHTVIDVGGPAARAKLAAAECHRSQLGSGAGSPRIFTLLNRFVPQRETFMRAYPEPPARATREHDLFAGVS